MASIHWLSGVSGDWGTGADWSGGVVPGASDAVTIAATGSFTVTVDSAEAAKSLTLDSAGATLAVYNSLTMGGALALTAGTLQLNSGGVINGGTLSATGGSFDWNGGVISDVTYDGTMALSQEFSLLFVKNGLTLTGAGGTGAGAVSISGALCDFVAYGSETLDNFTLTMSSQADNFLLYDPTNTTPVLTLGGHSSVVVTGSGDQIADYSFTSAAGNEIVNDGTITVGSGGASLAIDPVTFVNNGTITVSNGGVMKIGAYGDNVSFTNAAGGDLAVSGAGSLAVIGGSAGSWSNAGTISVSAGARVALGDSFTTAQLTRITDSGTITIYGVMTNTGSTLTVGPGAADPIVQLRNGYGSPGLIVGGTVVDKGSGMVFQGGTLAGVSFDGTLDLSPTNSYLTVYGGLGLAGVNGTGPGTISLTGSYATLRIDGGETLSNGTLDIGAYHGPNLDLFDPSGDDPVLTLASTFSIVQTGVRAQIFPGFNEADGAIVNQGTITAGVSGGNFLIQGGSFTNDGTIAVSNDDTFNLEPTVFTEGAGGTLSVASGGTLNLGVAMTTAQLAAVSNTGGTVGIAGALTNTGATLTVGPATSEPHVALQGGGVIVGGTIVDEGGGMLFHGGTLSGVTFDGTLNLSPTYSAVYITGGLTTFGVNGTGQGTITTGFITQFDVASGETLNNATLELGFAGSLNLEDQTDTNPVLTLGAGFDIVQSSNGGSIGGGNFANDAVVNDGVITADFDGGNGLAISTPIFTNNGSVVATNGGLLSLQPNVLSNLSGTTLTGGVYEADGGSTIQLNQNAQITADDATIILNGTGSTIQGFNTTANAQVDIDSTLSSIGVGGALELLGGRNWTSTLALANAGTLDLGGGTFTAPTLTNAGTVSGSGVIAATLANSGSLAVASSGTLSLVGGSLGNLSGTTLTGGTYTVGAGGTLQLANNVSIATLKATVDLAGAGATIQSLNTTKSSQVSLASSLKTIGATGVLEILGGDSYTTTNTLANSGTIQLGGGTLTAGGLANSGLLTGYGDVDTTVSGGGTISAQAGHTLSFQNGNLNTNSATTFIIGAGATVQLPDNFTFGTLDLIVDLNGPGSEVQSLNTTTDTELTIEQGLTGISSDNGGGVLKVLAGRNYTTTNAFTNDGTLQLGGGTFSSGKFTNDADGTLTGFGAVASPFSDAGTTTSSGGALAFTGKGDTFAVALTGTEIDFSGGTDLLQSGSSLTSKTVGLSGGAVVTLSTSQSFAGKLTQASGTTLALGANTLTLTGTGTTLAGAITGTGGTLALTGGTVAIDAGASLSVSNLSLSGGTASVNASLTYAGAFTEGSGATLTVATTDKLTLTGAASLSGTINGAGTVKVSNATVSGLTIGGTAILSDAGTAIQTGTLTIGDTTAKAAQLNVAVGATYTIENDAGIDRGHAATSSIRNSGTLIGAGSGLTLVAVKTVDTGSIVAEGGVLEFNKAMTGTGSMAVDAGATLELTSTAAATLSMSFNGADATLALKDPAKFAATIAGFAAGDTIDLVDKKATSAVLGAGDKLVITNGATAVATLQLTGTYTGDTFSVASDGAGGTSVTVTTGRALPPGAPAASHQFIAAMAALGACAGATVGTTRDVHPSVFRPVISPPGAVHLA